MLMQFPLRIGWLHDVFQICRKTILFKENKFVRGFTFTIGKTWHSSSIIEEFRKGAKRPQWNSDFMNKIEARSNTGFKPILLAYWSPDGNPKKQTTGSKNKTLNQNDNE